MMRSPGLRVRLLNAAALLLLAASPCALAQYGGIGGFGGAGAGMGSMSDSSASQSPRVSFRPWVSANGTYSEILSQNAPGVLPQADTYGYGAAVGVSGGKAFTRTMVAGFYTASYQRYSQSLYSRGLNQVGGITVQHKASERTTLFASEFAGSSNGGYGYGAAAGAFGGWGVTGSSIFGDLGAGGIGFSDPASNGLVDNELFSTRVHYTGTSGGVSYQPNLRWNFTATGSGSFVRRKANGLSDLNAYSAGGQTAYRVNQSTQVGGFYQFGEFTYPNRFGGNRVHQAGLMTRYRWGPSVTVSLMAGAFRYNSTFLGQVAIDPILAELLGQGTSLSISKLSRTGWTGAVALNRSWHNWSANVAYNRGVSPGNGVMLVSKRDAVTGGASTSVGRLSLGAFGGYYELSGLLQSGTSTRNGSVGGTAGVRLVGNLYLGTSAGYSRFETNATKAQWRRFVAVHLTWSPEDAAFRF